MCVFVYCMCSILLSWDHVNGEASHETLAGFKHKIDLTSLQINFCITTFTSSWSMCMEKIVKSNCRMYVYVYIVQGEKATLSFNCLGFLSYWFVKTCTLCKWICMIKIVSVLNLNSFFKLFIYLFFSWRKSIVTLGLRRVGRGNWNWSSQWWTWFRLMWYHPLMQLILMFFKPLLA